MKFPYQQYQTWPSPTVPSGLLHRPEILLRVIGKAGTVSLSALVDCGSDDTILPLSVGQATGAMMDPTQSWSTEGIGGQAVPVVLGEVTLELSDGSRTFRWLAKVGFVDFADPKDEIALLGHAGCLDYFRMTCDGHLQTVEVELTPSFPGQVL